MLDTIKSFFTKHLEPEAGAAPETFRSQQVPVAACALMLELAHADDRFAPEEQDYVQRALMRHFDLPPGRAQELMALAEEERRRSVDLFQFTSMIAANYDEGQKMVLVEAMWGLVYSDGQLSQHESYIMHKLSNLLGLAPGYLAEARKRAVGDAPQR